MSPTEGFLLPNTVTRVGYGDTTAVTNAGRLIGMFTMVIGLGFVAVVTGAIAHHVIARKATESRAASADEILDAVDESG